MDPGGGFGGAFGGAKAGGAQDPLIFLKKPVVMVRLAALLFGLIIFGTISSQGWTREDGKSKCVINDSTATCHFATFVGVMGFIGGVGLLIGEWFFEQFSSIKTRKHYVILDMAYSCLWSGFSAICFLVLAVGWSKSDRNMYDYFTSNILGAIFFAFCSIFAWGGGGFYAYQRFKAGSDAAFSQGLGDDEGFGTEAPAGGYVGGGYDESGGGGQYGEAPFSGAGQSAGYTQQMQY